MKKFIRKIKTVKRFMITLLGFRGVAYAKAEYTYCHYRLAS